MRDGKQIESISNPLRRVSSSSSMAASTYSHRTSNDSNDEPSSSSIFSRSYTNSTCTSTINSSSIKDEALTTSTRHNTSKSQPKTSSRLQAPLGWKRRHSFRETASQLIPVSSSIRGRSPLRSIREPSPLHPSRTSSIRRSESSERPICQNQNQNVHTECGRHSNNWLFGGFSVTESLRKMMERRDKS